MSVKDFPVETVVTQGETLRLETLPLGVKRLVLSRPDVRNAFDETMMREIRGVLEDLAGLPNSEMRVLVLAGEGSVFSAGADLGYMKRLAHKGERESLADARKLAELFHRLADFPAPVVAVVQGAAIGGGLGLAVCADFVLSEESAIFATSEVLLGIVPGVISPYMVRKIGLGAAAPMMLTGRRLGAVEARELGLVQRVVTSAESDDALREILLDFLAAGPEAQRRTKELLKAAAPLPAPELVALTAEHIAKARRGAEGRHGLEAFFEKTAPRWASRVQELRKRS